MIDFDVKEVKLYSNDELICEFKDAVCKFTEPTDLQYDKQRWPMKSCMRQEVTFDCSNVQIDPLSALYIRHEGEKLRKKKDMVKPKRVHWSYQKGSLFEFTNSTSMHRRWTNEHVPI